MHRYDGTVAAAPGTASKRVGQSGRGRETQGALRQRDVRPLDAGRVLALQRAVGNTGVAGLVAGSPSMGRRQRSPAVQRTNGTATSAPAASRPAAPLPEALVDLITSLTITSELARYQQVPVEITGTPTAPTGSTAPASPITIRVLVSATYFINTPRSRAHFRRARQQAHFNQIVRAARAQSSITSGGGARLSAGATVRFGKATPDDVRVFLQAAVDRGEIQRYARRTGALGRGQDLVDLGPTRLRDLVQGFARHVGVGVDCSGFMVHAAAEARRNVRALAGGLNALLGIVGSGRQFEVPAEPSTRVRGAAGFTSGPRVTSPTHLRPGDAWVVSGGGHIRMISAVRRVEVRPGVSTVEFDTAESSGTSTSTTPGPVAKTWRTASLTALEPISPVGGATGNRRGTFHRIP